MLEDALGLLAASPLAAALKDARYAYPVANAIHIMALATLFGAILALDLRLLGVARAIDLRTLARYLPRVAGSGLALAVLSGLLLFSVQPFDYVGNGAFLLKISLVALGTLHALWLHRTAAWRELVDGTGPIGVGAGLRASATLSLSIWIAAILAGRFIAY